MLYSPVGGRDLSPSATVYVECGEPPPIPHDGSAVAKSATEGATSVMNGQ